VAKTEGKVWKLINRERKRRKRINEKIRMEEWKEYFMRLMRDVEQKMIRGSGRAERKKDQEEKSEKRDEEIKRWQRDGVPSEAWKYGEVEIEKQD